MSEDYTKHYSENEFWKKIQSSAQDAGREIVEKGLILYYCANDPKTPTWAKALIGTTLGYFIFPLDAIPDFTPVVGYADDIGAIIAASAALGASINKRHIASAKKKVTEWFGAKKRNTNKG